MKLEQWQIEIINKAFTACYGLKSCLINNLPQSLESLAARTGIRLSFLSENLNQIKSL